MFAEDDSIIPPPNGIQEMTTCTSHLPPLVLRLTTPHIYTWRIYKYTALLGPNVCLAEAQKLALPRQLEEIGSICSLHRSADNSSRLSDLGYVCWEIKQSVRRSEVTMLCWNWPEVCPGPGDWPHFPACVTGTLYAKLSPWNVSSFNVLLKKALT